MAWWARAVLAALALTAARAYLIIVPDTAPPGYVVLDAAVYKLGSERTYTIDVHRTANFVHHILRVNRTSGLVTLRKRLRCDGVLYPNLFTFYVDSTSDRIRDIDYYSLPIRILVAGEDCSRRHADLYDIDFDRVYDQDDAALQYEEDNVRDKREAIYQESIDWRLLEEEELGSSQYSVLSTAYPWSNVMFEDFSFRNRSRNKRSPLVPFDMAIDVKIAEAKQWISETYASFGIPTTDRWQGICLKNSQFVNSLTAFLPRTVQKQCKVQFLDVSDPRFVIENSQGDLVASSDVCIHEPMWKVSVLFTFNCDRTNIVDSDHRLKIVYHHQELNDTDIARRVKRELRNQSPYFEQALYVASVAEEQPPGVIVTTVRARDPENSPVTYSISSLLDSRSAGMFAVDTRTGVVTTQARLDRERLDVHYFRVVAQDDTFPPRSGTTTLQINVLDCNDHAPVFEMQQYEASVREGASTGTTVLTLKATDQDIGKNAEVEYSIDSVKAEYLNPEMMNESIDSEQVDAREVFRVDSRSGALLTRASLDREKVSRYTVIVKATDQASPLSDRMSSSATVHVNILDDNDNYPQFSEKTYTVNVDEDISVADNPVIARIKATDADVGPNAAIRYAIIGGNTQMQFSIDSLSGDISLVKQLDYEQVRNYRLVIRAQDGGSPSRSNTTQLLVNVKDVNDNAPRFYTSLFQESVSESVPVGYSIVRVQAYDADEGVNAELTYTLQDKEYNGNNDLPITIDPHSGWVFTSSHLDREVQSKYQLLVTATDGGTPPRSATASVVVVVQDVNDNDPVFSPPQYDVELAEDEPPGTPVVTVTATDADEDNRLHYEITGGNTRGRFSITSQNGRGLITVAQPLDFKQERRYVLTVTATDSGGRADTAMVHINITDANNYAPVFENAPYTASVFEDAPVGTTVLVVSATDSDVGVNAQITYTLSSEISNEAVAHREQEFLINPQTGAITTNKLLDRETMSGYLLTVTARDGGVPSLSDTTDVEISVVDVNDNEPIFKQQLYTASIMEDALVGTSVTQVSATDADVGLNGRVHYELEPRDREEGSFVIDPASGVIRTNKALDRESVAIYDLKALAIDGGTPPQSSSVIVHIKVEDINDSPPVFESDCLTFYIQENSPIGTTVGEIYAHDPDEGPNAVVHYSIKGGDDSNSFSLETRQGSDKAELITMVDLDYESPRKKYELIIRAASPPLWNDVRVEILVTDVNDNAPMLKDFQIIFNNYKDCFPVGPFGKVPAYDADVTDKLQYRILSGNNANLVLLNETTGSMTLSPQLNTNVPKLATMEISVTDGVNEVKAMMQLLVRLITEEILFNSITVRLNDMTAEQFLSPLLAFFIDGLAAIIPCPKENIYIFSVQDDTDVTGNILNVSFSAKRPDAEVGIGGDSSQYYSPTHLRERVYLHRATLARLATVQVLPFDDNICVHEPCLNYEECLTVLKFGNASGFIHSDTVLFRPIYPVTTFTCQCPQGFTGSREHYMCDTEVDLCYSSPCKNNGTCVRRESGYTCVCGAGFTGVNCETILTKATCDMNGDGSVCRSGSQCVAKKEGGILCQGCTIDAAYTTAMCELRARSFPTTSFLTFPGLKKRHRFHLKLKFATQTTSGLLLYNGRYNERHDFIALEVISSGAGAGGGSGVRFTFALGGGKTEVTVEGDVADGVWHTVELEYFNRTATIILDDCDKVLSLAGAAEFGVKFACANFTRKVLPPRCDIPTETCHRFLDLTGPLQIGGLPNIPSSFQVKNKDFVGCISDLFIDHKFIDLNSFVSDNGTLAGCPEKRSQCTSAPCYNDGECLDLWDTFLCTCKEGYTGKDCADSTSPPWRFSGDGMLSFNPLLRPIQLPWLNALSIRTRQHDAFLMSVQVGQNSSVLITLKSGLLHYSYNGETMFLPSTTLADGSWHRIEIKWLGTDISVSIDYGLRTALLPMLANKIQGQYIGKILIGGLDTTAGLLASDVGYFEGCIQDVRVGTAQSLLNRPTVRENVRDGCQSRADCMLSICPPYSKCVSSWDNTECACDAGRLGPQCVAACDLNPCGEHALCVPSDGAPGYSCSCFVGYMMTGEETCHNNTECACDAGRLGPQCVAACDLNPCGEHALCVPSDGAPGYSCSCFVGYMMTGEETCHNNTECACDAGRLGPQCVAACDLNPCGEHALCVPSDGAPGFSCSCFVGYMMTGEETCHNNTECACDAGRLGPQCVAACDLNPCGEHALCVPSDGVPGYSCSCFVGYMMTGEETCHNNTECACDAGRLGPQCVAACDLNPCGEHALCVPSDGAPGYSCRCFVGYMMTGEETCHNNTECACDAGRLGPQCVAACDFNPCGEHALCVPSDGAPGYSCSCFVGYMMTGEETCHNNTECACDAGRLGPQCVAACDLNPCGEHALCVPSDGAPGYSCSCFVGYMMTGEETCHNNTECACDAGRLGPQCVAACDLNPCGEHALCVPSDGAPGYSCSCFVGYIMTAQGCVEEDMQECPSGWWGSRRGACGPCACDARGLHPHCNTATGQCRCKENHYKPLGSEQCVPCQCYAAGSLNGSCEALSGQCYCRSGVIGRACDSCANLYAEVTPNAGCKVVYDGCPRSFSHGVWWPQTKFGVEAITDCPTGSSGKAKRLCDKTQVIPWQEPDMFNCTTSTFYQLRKQLHKIETSELQVNTFVGVRLADDLASACANTPTLFGADVLVAEGILLALMQYELRQAGLNLTHSQDKDYVRNIVKSSNTILNIKYEREWHRIRELTGRGAEHLLQHFDKYIAVLAESQHDTYTSPFEIATSDLVIGVDIVTAESIYGFEPATLNRYGDSFTTERVILPDTSSFIHSPIQTPGYYGIGKAKKKPSSPTVSFPKYNNYVKSKNKFDKFSRVLLPLDLIGINSNGQDNLETNYESRAVFSYLQYSRNTSQLMPLRMDESVSRRWGVNITVGSPILQVALFVPEYVWARETTEADENAVDSNMDDLEGITYNNKGNHHQSVNNHISNQHTKDDTWPQTDDESSNHENHGPVVIQPAYKKSDKIYNENFQENDSSYTAERLDNSEGPKVLALTMDDKTKEVNSTKEVGKRKLVYKGLNGVRLKKPIRLQLWLDINRETFGSRTNPQCVHWSTLRGSGEWSRVGCHTEIDYDWSPYSDEPLLINCTCNHLSTFAVLVDEVDIEFIPEPSLLESVTSYTGFSISLPLLLWTWAALCLMRGGAATVSNSIHKHLIFCVFMAELLYLIALKARNSLVQNEFACKVVAMGLHYWWVCALAWCACDAWQLRRLVRELRDVNHGPLCAQLAAAYAAPAVALALAAAQHQHQYGNALFCWVSCHEAVVWWVVVPAGVYALAALVFLAGATRAAFTVRDHVIGFGNLRMLLAVSIVCLPLLCTAWASALILGSEAGDKRNVLSSVLAGAVALHAAAASLGYIAFNMRVRDNLKRTILRCLGKKVPLADTSVIISTSAQNLSQVNRSALAYHSSAEGGRQLRNIGISASSTTSRSTTKTSSSPYSRSDGQLRHTSTSTSNYNTSASDMPAYLRGFDSSLHTRKEDESRRRRKNRGDTEEATEGTEGTEGTDSESEASARSLDLASSHSSDDDDTTSRRSSHPPSSHRDRGTSGTGGSYLPNITEGAPLAITPRWPSHIREESNRPDMGRWSQETASEDGGNPGPATPSPNPLPNPDLTSEVYQLSRHRLKPSILENVHDTYVASVDASRLPLDNRYGVMEDELMYGGMPTDSDKQMPYDPTYPISPTMYRLPTNPYGSKTYLSSRTSDYGYSPTKYHTEPSVYGSRDFRDSSVTTREHDGYPPRDFRDSGIATMLKNDYQRKMEQYDYSDRMSDGSDQRHPHDKYLFPYTAEEDHASVRSAQSPQRLEMHAGEGQPQMGAPLASMGETSEKSTTEDDAETRV